MFRGKTSSRIVAFFLALMMLVTFVPTSVFARDNGGDSGAVPLGETEGTGSDGKGDTIEIDGIFSTIVLGAEEQENGDYYLR